MRRAVLLAALTLVSSACTVERAVSSGRAVPRERADECRANCASLDMQLTAVVLVLNSAGCVCEPKASPSAPASAGAGGAAAGGAAAASAQAVLAAQEQQRRVESTPSAAPVVAPVR